MLSIEFEEPQISRCACCHSTTTTLTRFILKDGTAHAIYYAKFAEGPAHDEAYILLGLGNWDEGAPRASRTAFYFKLWAKNNEFVTTLLEPSPCPWETDFLGRILSREEALSHSWLPEVFAIGDQIIAEDEPVRKFLNSLPGRSQ